MRKQHPKRQRLVKSSCVNKHAFQNKLLTLVIIIKVRRDCLLVSWKRTFSKWFGWVLAIMIAQKYSRIPRVIPVVVCSILNTSVGHMRARQRWMPIRQLQQLLISINYSKALVFIWLP